MLVLIRGKALAAGWHLGRTVVAAWSLLALAAGHAEAAPPDQPMTFEWRTVPGAEQAIFAEGVILPETPEAFRNFARTQLPALGATLVLNSDGGDLEGGLELGRAIRNLGLKTIVADAIGTGASAELTAGRCASACALAFLGGVSRSLHVGSEYGVHQLRMECVERWRSEQRYPWLPLPGTRYCPDFDEAMSAFQSAQGAVATYVAEMGADPLLVSQMAETSASDVQFLSEREAATYRVTSPLDAANISE